MTIILLHWQLSKKKRKVGALLIEQRIGKAVADQLGIPAFRLFSTFTLNEKVIHDFGKTGGWYMTFIFRNPLLCKIVSQLLKKKWQIIRLNWILHIQLKNFRFIRVILTAHVINTLDHHWQSEEKEFDFSKIENPIIYISLGTLLNTSVKFFRKCLDAFRNQRQKHRGKKSGFRSQTIDTDL